MIKLIKYTGDKTYMYPNGQLATPEKVKKDFPAIMHFAHVIETDENEQMFNAVINLSQLRSIHNIDPALSESEAIEAIQAIINTPPQSTEPTAEERIAAALEFQNLLAI